MAEVLGTTVGVISLTIQLYDIISKHVENFKTRDHQVGAILRRLQSIKETLQSIESVGYSFENKHPEASNEVSAQVRACQEELKGMSELVHEFAPEGLPPDTKGKMKEVAKRIKFSFNRDAIEKLDLRLDKAQHALSMAMNCLQLYSQSDTSLQLSSISTNHQQHTLVVQNEFRNLEGKLNQLQVRSETSSSTLTTFGADVLDIKKALPAMTDEVKAVSGAISAMTRTEIRSQQDLMELIDARLAAFGATLGAKLDTFSDASTHQQDNLIKAMILAKPARHKELFDLVDAAQEIDNTPVARQQARTMANQEIQTHNTQISDIGTASSIMSAHRTTMPCGCRLRRRQYSRTSQSLFSFSFLETFDETLHSPSCRRLGLGRLDSSHTKAIMFTGLRRYLSAALSVGYTMSHGAGGQSISASLGYWCMVDRKCSPVFRLLSELSYAVDYLSEEKELSQVADYAISTLRHLYTSKRSSPTDVDEDGATALTHFASSRGTLVSFWRLFDELLELGVPTQGVGSKYSAR